MMEKVRSAVFNMLQSLSGLGNQLPPGSRWLDLFAGTGGCQSKLLLPGGSCTRCVLSSSGCHAEPGSIRQLQWLDMLADQVGLWDWLCSRVWLVTISPRAVLVAVAPACKHILEQCVAACWQWQGL